MTDGLSCLVLSAGLGLRNGCTLGLFSSSSHALHKQRTSGQPLSLTACKRDWHLHALDARDRFSGTDIGYSRIKDKSGTPVASCVCVLPLQLFHL